MIQSQFFQTSQSHLRTRDCQYSHLPDQQYFASISGNDGRGSSRYAGQFKSHLTRTSSSELLRTFMKCPLGMDTDQAHRARLCLVSRLTDVIMPFHFLRNFQRGQVMKRPIDLVEIESPEVSDFDDSAIVFLTDVDFQLSGSRFASETTKLRAFYCGTFSCAQEGFAASCKAHCVCIEEDVQKSRHHLFDSDGPQQRSTDIFPRTSPAASQTKTQSL